MHADIFLLSSILNGGYKVGKADRKEARQQEATKALMNIEDINDYSLITSNLSLIHI